MESTGTAEKFEINQVQRGRVTLAVNDLQCRFYIPVPENVSIHAQENQSFEVFISQPIPFVSKH